MGYRGDAIKVNERPDQFRRKAQTLGEDLYDIVDYIKGLPAYGGVWREQDVAPVEFDVTTDWQVLLGYNELRPPVTKKMDADFTTGTLTVLETGIYEVCLTIVYKGPIARYFEIGARTNGIDPPQPAISQEILTNTGDMTVNYTTDIGLMNVPLDYEIVVRGEANYTIDFVLGGWSIKRLDYNNPTIPQQRIF